MRTTSPPRNRVAVSRPPSSVLDCAIPPSTPAPLPSLHSCMAALHAAESHANAAPRCGMLRFLCPCRPPCPGRSHNSPSTSGRGRARLYAVFTTEATEVTEPDRKEKGWTVPSEPFLHSDLCVLCALCGERRLTTNVLERALREILVRVLCASRSRSWIEPSDIRCWRLRPRLRLFDR
jgi:hypothetical protein